MSSARDSRCRATSKSGSSLTEIPMMKSSPQSFRIRVMSSLKNESGFPAYLPTCRPADWTRGSRIGLQFRHRPPRLRPRRIRIPSIALLLEQITQWFPQFLPQSWSDSRRNHDNSAFPRGTNSDDRNCPHLHADPHDTIAVGSVPPPHEPHL